MEKSTTGTSSVTKGIYSEEALSFATSLLENSNDLVAAIDTNLRVVALNAPFRREFELIFGKSLSAGQCLDEALSHLTGDRDKAIGLCHRALSGESFRVNEDFGDDRLIRKRYELAFSPIFDTHHQPIFAAIVVRDLTLMRDSEQRFGALLEAAPDATIIMRSDGFIELANAHAERMFGYGRHEMNGLLVEKLMPARFHARHVAQRNQFALRPAARPMGTGKTSLLGMRKDGTEFPVEISLNPIGGGNDQMVVAAIRDMSIRQRTEDQLRELSVELEKRVAERTLELEQATKAFRSTFEQASVGIAHVSISGGWLRVNQRLCDIVGYTEAELLSLTFQDITYPGDLDFDLKLMYRLLAGQIPSYSMDKRYLHKNGDIVWINLDVSLVRDDHGAPQYFISVIKDISATKRAEAEAQTSKESLTLAVEATGIGIFDYYPQTGQTNWSPEMKHLFGLPADAHVELDAVFKKIHPDDRKNVEEGLRRSLQGENSGAYRYEYRTQGNENGQERWVEARWQVFFDEKGKPIRCVGTALDVSDKKRAEEKIRQNERQLRLIFDANPIGTVKAKINGEVTDANAACLRIIGRTREDLQEGKINWIEQTPFEYVESDKKAIQQALKHGVSELYEKEYVRPNGERIAVLLACALLGTGDNLVAFILDISERKVAEELLRRAALHDPLTGLPNRGLLFDFATRIFGRSRREHLTSAVLFVDLDRFKPINDTYGHEVGDEVLKEVAQRLSHCTRADDVVFRLGGDEFLVLLPVIDHEENAGDVARHVIHCLNKVYKVKGLEASLSASVGISIYPQDGDEIDVLIHHADVAMYHAKQGGRSNFQYYSKELAARSQFHTKIEEHLQTALAQNTFTLHYQPVVDMQSTHLMSVEALVRWPHSDIGPDQFVPVAETAGYITRLGDWVLCEACRQYKRWLEHGLPAIPIAVNVSAAQFRQKNFAEYFLCSLERWSVPATALQVEVTETALMENIDHAIAILEYLKNLGIQIALDDFGTGYSSLNYLSRLPINKIKVDKSFIQRVSHDAPSRAIAEAVIALGHSLNLEVVAEGIESEDTMNYLRRHGCNQAQGYHVCRPMKPGKFEAWYRSHSKMSDR